MNKKEYEEAKKETLKESEKYLNEEAEYSLLTKKQLEALYSKLYDHFWKLLHEEKAKNEKKSKKSKNNDK